MIYKGNKKCVLYHGDNHPASLYIGDKKISGYKLETLTGKGKASWTSPYKANLPSVTVKGAGEQEKLKGYNLLDMACIKATSAKPYGMTVTLVNGKFRIYGKSTTTMIAFFTIAYAIDSRYSGKGYTLYTRNWEGSKFDHKKIYGFRTETEKSIAIGIDLTEGVDYDFSFNILMTKGDGSALPYEPYCGGIPAPNPEYPIEPKFLERAKVESRGKNLWDMSIFNTSLSDVGGVPAKYFKETGLVTLDGICTNTGGRNAWYYIKSNRFYFKAGVEYFFYVNTYGDITDTSFIFTNEKNGMYITAASGNILKKFVPKEDMVCWFGVNLMKLKEYSFSFKLCISKSPVDSYFPFFDGGTADIPILRALPDGSVRDEYDVVSGKLTRRIAELVLTGNENWALNQFLLNRNVNAYQLYLGGINSTGNNTMLSNYFKGAKWDNGVQITQNNYASAAGAVIVIRTDGKQSVSDFKKLLSTAFNAGNPVKVWYALATPIIEQYDPTVIRQHPGYTQLIQQGGFTQTDISATAYIKETK